MTRVDPALPPGGSQPALAGPSERVPLDQSLLFRYRWLAFGLVLVLFVAAFNGHWRVGRDSATFRGIARNLVRSHQYVFRPRTPSARAARRIEKQEVVYPGTPLLLAAVQRVFGEGDLAPHLAMYALAALTLLLVFRFYRSTLGRWVAVAVVLLLGTNRIFLEHANELLSDLPFVFGLMLSLLGFEKLRRFRSSTQLINASIITVLGLCIAISTRPTALILALAWIVVCILGLIWPEQIDGQRRRSPYLIALLLLLGLGLSAYLLDPRARAAGVHLGGYEQKVKHQLEEWGLLLRQAYEHKDKTLNEHLPTCVFAFAVKQSSSLAAKIVMGIYSLMVVGAGVALVRVSRLWGVLVAVSVVSLSVLGDNPRYYLMILPLLLAGWCLFCAPIARWLGPDRQQGHAWANRLFGWAPRHPLLPTLAMLWGLGIIAIPNVIRDLDLVREQRGFDRRLHYVGFVQAYAEGKIAPLVHAAQIVKRSAPPSARVLGPEPTILTYMSDRQVFDLDRMTGRWGHGWRDGLVAMNLQLAVFPAHKAVQLYGDRDPVVCLLFDRKILVPQKVLDQTPDGAKLAEFTIRLLPGEHVRGNRAVHYHTRRRRYRTTAPPAGLPASKPL